ncbi:MAG TPA: isoprenylcysteine carboxylmethyltransferase family protein [Blastocatellia bacterium]|nr:isoprenylcysteine carboxylmethyltransferase family protein [Blastocatellia bacterium]
MSQPPGRISETTKTSWRSDLNSLAYFMIAFACLIKWGTASPWSRVNLFTGGFFVMTVAWLLHLRGMNKTTLRSEESKTEFSGVDYDPDAHTKLGRLFDLWPVVDLFIIIEYAHLHLVPALEQTSLQAAGLALFVIDFIFVLWIDSHLVQFFARDKPDRQLITEGPYRHIRHPRYAAIMTYRLVYALIFASVIGWFMVAVFALAVSRRIRFEETHMQGLFGEQYEAYARRTARLVPGVY